MAWPDSPWRKTYGNASEPVIVTAAGRGQSGDLNNLLRLSHLLISLFFLLSYVCFWGTFINYEDLLIEAAASRDADSLNSEAIFDGADM